MRIFVKARTGAREVGIEKVDSPDGETGMHLCFL